MSTSDNFPTTTSSDNEPSNKNFKNGLIAILSIALIAVAGYLIVDKNKTGEVIQQQQSQIAKVTDDKSEIQRNFDASLVRLDSMTTVKTGLESKLTASNSEISKDKAEIRSILNKKNVTAAELNRAKDLIAQLNGKISNMEEDIARLTKDNESLNQDKMALVQDTAKLNQDVATTTATNQDLAKKVDIGSTLNASNIIVTPVKIKGNGEEKVTTNAKRVDKLMISFNVNNRIAQAGQTDVYVCITGPDGKTVTTVADQSGTFTTRDEGDKSFTAKVPVVIESDKTKNVEFGLKPDNHFIEGNYTIQIYQNGFKIGEATRELKKGGLFS
jgi:peptidoglycan hydrolase CwlO-like protein